ncbi:FHA domain-containing protein [Paenibacillus psychroresistens]|uniref:FHA domain-containing protein n=1 Tax=Paenibacillus psychroresistens TaxID=1778678 RepID=A0A6B8RMT0_9BACL|nr:DUF6382 domain-containing protein [Paenibacillus psychroresistens]QGQ96668.1 FHA domain-containing protein [Paenibacillus psychroresistens]
MTTNYIYGLKYALTLNPEPCLVFSKDSVWTEDDLIAIEKKMMISYPISKLLPLQINEMDLQITLCYRFGTRRTLSHVFQHQLLSEMECMQLLIAIVSTILNSKAHLLNEERYLIQDSFIYLGADHMDVSLVYLPIKDLSDKPPLQQELLKLTNNLLSKQDRVQSHSIRKIFLMLNSPHFQLTALKDLLLEVILELDFQPAATILQPDHTYEPWLPQTTKERFIQWRLPKTHNPTLLTFCILIIMLIGTLYFMFPTVGNLNLCLGLCLMVLNIGFMMNRSLAKMETGELPSDQRLGSFNQQQVPLEPATDYYVHLADQTTLLTSNHIISDATVLLTPAPKAFLELKQGEESELIKISNDAFIIGRSTEAAHFNVNWIGLSRTHFEISRLENDYQVKDLGSKNGSFLNDESMVPHQSYPLNEGDCIKVVEKQFIYKKL